MLISLFCHFQIDLVDDIPNNKEDDDIEEVAIIEKVSITVSVPMMRSF